MVFIFKLGLDMETVGAAETFSRRERRSRAADGRYTYSTGH